MSPYQIILAVACFVIVALVFRRMILHGKGGVVEGSAIGRVAARQAAEAGRSIDSVVREILRSPVVSAPLILRQLPEEMATLVLSRLMPFHRAHYDKVQQWLRSRACPEADELFTNYVALIARNADLSLLPEPERTRLLDRIRQKFDMDRRRSATVQDVLRGAAFHCGRKEVGPGETAPAPTTPAPPASIPMEEASSGRPNRDPSSEVQCIEIPWVFLERRLVARGQAIVKNALAWAANHHRGSFGSLDDLQRLPFQGVRQIIALSAECVDVDGKPKALGMDAAAVLLKLHGRMEEVLGPVVRIVGDPDSDEARVFTEVIVDDGEGRLAQSGLPEMLGRLVLLEPDLESAKRTANSYGTNFVFPDASAHVRMIQARLRQFFRNACPELAAGIYGERVESGGRGVVRITDPDDIRVILRALPPDSWN